MNSDLGLVLYYNKNNRFSFNALAGAIETNEALSNLDIEFVERGRDMPARLGLSKQEHKQTIVGFSFFSTQLQETRELVQICRAEMGSAALLVAGGPHPSGDPVGTLRMGFDLVVRGEGEETFLELLERVQARHDYRALKGIAYLDEKGEYHYGGRRPAVALDRYPPFAVSHRKFGHIEITRGCPYACYYCQTPSLAGAHPRHRSVDQIGKFVEINVGAGLHDIRFITPNALSYGSNDGKTLDLKALEQLLSEVRKRVPRHRGRIFFGSFPSEVRPEHVVPETIELIRRYTDNDNLIIGGQSGSQRVLDLCHRGHTVEDVYKSVELTLEANLTPNVDFIFGLPGETLGDTRQSMRVMRDLMRMGARIHAHTFMPLPQTPFAKSPSGKVGNEVRRMVDEYLGNGLVYGDWQDQERAGKEISAYLRTGRIKGC